MTDMPTKQQQKFIVADFCEKVRLAEPVARDILLFSNVDLENADDAGAMTRLMELTGYDRPDCPDDEITKLETSLESLHALGIAVGLLMRPELFRAGAVALTN